MFKSRLFRSVWLRAGLGLLLWEAVVLALSWLWFRRLYWLHNFGDVLLLVGFLELTAASMGMLRDPYHLGGSVPAFPVQSDDRERQYQAVADYVEKRTFATRLFASGVLTILISLAVTYIQW